MKEYHRRVLEAAEEGADFIKIMTTGLLDFEDHGKITGTPLSAAEVKEMVHIAHEEGFAVMSHTNGNYGVQAAVEAGVDSIEHANYMDEETLSMLSLIHISPATTFAHLDATTVLSRKIVEQGIYPAVDPLESRCV